jgi:hypothetical protein
MLAQQSKACYLNTYLNSNPYLFSSSQIESHLQELDPLDIAGDPAILTINCKYQPAVYFQHNIISSLKEFIQKIKLINQSRITTQLVKNVAAVANHLGGSQDGFKLIENIEKFKKNWNRKLQETKYKKDDEANERLNQICLPYLANDQLVFFAHKNHLLYEAILSLKDLNQPILHYMLFSLGKCK